MDTNYDEYCQLNMPDRIVYEDELPDLDHYSCHRTVKRSDVLEGIGVSRGTVTAQAAVIDKPSLDQQVTGKILVTRMTDPGWVFLMAQSVGIVSEKGSLLSHTAIVGRELGIPVVVDVDNITRLAASGDVITINGTTGEVKLHEDRVRELNRERRIPDTERNSIQVPPLAWTAVSPPENRRTSLIKVETALSRKGAKTQRRE